jgi:ATP-dependent RNA helicase DDX41
MCVLVRGLSAGGEEEMGCAGGTYIVCGGASRGRTGPPSRRVFVHMSDSTQKRRRIQRSPSPPVYKLDDGDDAYEPYVPVAQRRQAKLAKLSALSSTSDAREKAKNQLEELLEKEDAEREEERRREGARKERTLLVEAQEVHSRKAAEGARLAFISRHLVSPPPTLDAGKTEVEKAEEADAEIFAAIASRRKLASDLELAQGIQYSESLRTSYAPRPTHNALT